MDFLKSYASIILAIATVIVSLITQWAVFGVRLSNVEGRQDRQGTAIMTLQTDVTGLSNDIAGIKAKVDSINDNVNFIRDRIVRVTQ